MRIVLTHYEEGSNRWSGLQMSSMKKGKAGELLVANELLRHGFDVYAPFVDTGVDLICLENYHPVLIQVKESRRHKSRRDPSFARYWIKFSEKKFLDYIAENMFYVFVLKSKESVDYLILPSTFINENRERIDFGRTGMVNFYFEFNEKEEIIETRKSQLNLTRFLNNFEILKKVTS